MIKTQCAVFAAMFAAGLLAEMLSAFLLLLGRSSKPARALFDLLAPLSVGTLYFFFLYLSASGAFRFYSFLAFVLGFAAARYLLQRFSPRLRHVAKRVFLPIKSLNDKLELRVSALFAPLAKRLKEKGEARKAKREEKRKRRAAERSKKQKRKGPKQKVPLRVFSKNRRRKRIKRPPSHPAGVSRHHPRLIPK